MVKIRLRRLGAKGRPFYRVVVAKSTAARNGKIVETIGTYDPLVKPTKIEMKQDRALHWLRAGAQPTETTAYLLNKVGVLEEYFKERPHAKKQYSFLDKRTAATSVASVVDQNVATSKKAAAPAPEPEPVVEAAAPVEMTADHPVETEAAATVEEVEPAAEAKAAEAPAEEPTAEETSAEGTSGEEAPAEASE